MLMKKDTPILMSNDDLKAIYERKKKMKAREPVHFERTGLFRGGSKEI